MLNIKIDKPLVFFDLETTGVSIQTDRIIEISVVKFFPGGEKEVKTRKINPEMHIPEESSAIHGITDADVAGAPTFKAVSKNLYIYLEDCDLGGYNIRSFDIPLLTNEFSRAGLEFSIEGRKVIDAYAIFCKKEPRSLEAAYRFYCGGEMTDAHSAEADILATVEVFDGQISKYSDLPHTVAELDEFCNRKDPGWVDATGKFRWQNGEAVVGFGRNSGTPLKSIAVENPGFLQWMINANFPEDTKSIAQNALKGEFPRKESEDDE